MKPEKAEIRDFVIAGHGNLAKVKQMLAESPGLLNAPYAWSDHDHETAIQAAAQTGAVDIAEFLLEQGAPPEICTAAMLGRIEAVQLLQDQDAALIQAAGSPGIPLMAHAAMSGNVDLAKLLWRLCAREGISFALSNAVTEGRAEMAEWLLGACKADPNRKNHEGKNALMIATEKGDQHIVDLLHRYGPAA